MNRVSLNVSIIVTWQLCNKYLVWFYHKNNYRLNRSNHHYQYSWKWVLISAAIMLLRILGKANDRKRRNGNKSSWVILLRSRFRNLLRLVHKLSRLECLLADEFQRVRVHGGNYWNIYFKKNGLCKRVEWSIDLLAVRMKTGVGEALAVVFSEEAALPQEDMVDFITGAFTIEPVPFLLWQLTFPATATIHQF